MRNILAIFILTAAVLSGCKKENDRAFSESPEERLTASLAKYQTLLESGVNGWKAYITTDSGKGTTYGFFIKFDNKNRVRMYSDFTATSAGTIKESSYRLKALQQITLMFDTYSYIHVLADPDPRVAGGEVGTGYNVDFEFYFDKVSNDTINLYGIKNGSKAKFVRATAAEETAFNAGDYAKSLQFTNINKYLNYFKRITIGGVVYQINVNTTDRTVIFTWLDANGNEQSFTTGYTYGLNGINFSNPLVNGSTRLNGFTNIVWNEPTTVLNVTSNGVAANITGTGQPIKVDIGAPRRWWQRSVDEDDYWVSPGGFHIDGVDDAHGLRSIPGFGALIYWARYGTSGGITYDLGGYIVSNSLSFGTAYLPPNFTVDGKVIFTALGTLGTVPAAATAKVAATRAKFVDAAGYYLVQTGANSYDMVSIDGRSWISWLW